MTLDPVEPTIRDRGPSPELIGGLASILIVGIVGLALLGVRLPSGPAASGPSASPSATVEPTATPTPLIDAAVADLLIIVSGQQLAAGERLADELDRDELRTADVSTIIREINASARFGADAATSLGTSPAATDVARRLGESNAAIREIATRTLRASVTNDAAYREGAELLLEELEELPGLQDELRALKAGALASAPVASPSAGPSTSPSPVPTAEPATPEPTPAPSETASGAPSASPAPTPGGPSQVVNGGFEAGVGAPWVLELAATASATIRVDPQDPAAGEQSARVDVTAATPAFGGIILRQPGIRVEAGARYEISVALRSAGARDVRVQVVSQEGDTYVTRLASTGLGWGVYVFDFIAPATDADALVELGLGRVPITTWIDEVRVSTRITNQPVAP